MLTTLLKINPLGIKVRYFSGMGSSCMYLAAPIIIQQHFNENRALAGGIAMAGLSTGNFLGPLIIHPLIMAYGWRGAMLIHAGIMLHTLVLAILFYPPGKKTLKKAMHGTYQGRTEELNNAARLEMVQYEKGDGCNSIDTEAEHKELSKPLKGDSVTLWQRRKVPCDVKKNTQVPLISLFKECCDFSLLYYPPFLLFCLAHFMLMFNTVSFWQHVLSRAIHTGIAMEHAALLLSIIRYVHVSVNQVPMSKGT